MPRIVTKHPRKKSLRMKRKRQASKQPPNREAQIKDVLLRLADSLSKQSLSFAAAERAVGDQQLNPKLLKGISVGLHMAFNEVRDAASLIIQWTALGS